MGIFARIASATTNLSLSTTGGGPPARPSSRKTLACQQQGLLMEPKGCLVVVRDWTHLKILSALLLMMKSLKMLFYHIYGRQ